MTRKPASLALGKVHQGDCIPLMRKMESGSVDLVFADPPFNIGYEYDEYHDRQEDEKYLGWCRNWISEVHRVLKPDGSFWLAIGDEYAAELKVAAQREIGFTTRSWVVWYYTFGVNCKYKFSRSHAHLFHFVKDAQRFTFNSRDPAIRVPSARALVYGDKRAHPLGRLPDDTRILRPQDFQSDRYGFTPEQDTWFFSRVAGTFKERQGFHGCQMPEQLLGRIIRASSNPGEAVLDPFAGSGTTLAVAKKLDREFVGCELSTEYVRAANKRLKAIHVGDPLDGPADPVLSAPSTANGVTLESRQSKLRRQPPNKELFPEE
jgi:site-specific DNA-methyltransferase (adenine-specific)